MDRAADFPFTIMDVASLLCLTIRRRGAGHVYVDCPICGDRRGKMNLNLTKNVWRCNYCGEGGGMLALYAKVYGVSNSDAYRGICDALQVGRSAPGYTTPNAAAPVKEVPQAERASRQEIHRTLTAMMSLLTLTPAQREHLRCKRGLTDAQIEQFGFKSTPPQHFCRTLAKHLAERGYTVQGVPGFYIDSYGKLTVRFHQRTSGILIPIRSADGLLCGLQTRLDKPIRDKDDPPEKTGIKYLTLSSADKKMGTTSGSPIHFIGDPCSRVVYVTEGALKADIARVLTGRTFAAMIGANNTAGLDELFAFLRKNGTREIIEAGKSARTIANEELAKQLIPESAKESLDTLAEIAAWIQAHPDDVAAINKAISDLTALVGALPEDAIATTVIGYVKEYADGAIAALKIGDYAKAADLTALAARVTALETDSHTHANKDVLDGVTAEKVTAWDAAEQNAKDYTDTALTWGTF